MLRPYLVIAFVLCPIVSFAQDATPIALAPFVTSQILPVSFMNDYSGYIGTEFTVGSIPLVVEQLGRYCLAPPANNSISVSPPHVLKIVTSNGTDVAGGATSVAMTGCTPGQYWYGTLPSPVTLSANAAYYLLSYELAGGDDWYNYTPVSAPMGSIIAAVYGFSLPYVIPVYSLGYSYGPLNVRFQTGTTAIVTSPQAGSSQSGLINVTATAGTAVEVTVSSIQLQVDGQRFGTSCTSSVCLAALDTTLLPNGMHSLSAVVADSRGGSLVSTKVPITVNNSSTAIGVLNGFLGTSTVGASGKPIDINGPLLRRDVQQWIGMAFQTGSVPLNVTAVGRLYVPGNSGSHTIKLVHADSGADVLGSTATVTFNGAIENRIAYAKLNTPITLAANTSYYLVSQEINGDAFYDYDNVQTISALAVTGPVYMASDGWHSVSTCTSCAFGLVDLAIEVPPITSMAAATITATTSLPSVSLKLSPAGYNHVLVTGQSLATGTFGAQALSTTQPYSNRMLSPDSLTPPSAACQGSLVDAAGSNLIPLVESGTERVDSAIGNTMTALSAGHLFNAIVTNAGAGGDPYSELQKGTCPYQAGLSQVSAAQLLAGLAGKTFTFAAVAVIHGESDEGSHNTAEAYEQDLVQWQQDYQNDGQGITHQTNGIPFFIDQENSWTASGLATPTVAIGQLSAAEDNPGAIVMVGPKYQYSNYHYSDGVHLNNYDYRTEGEQIGKVMKEVLLDGGTWKPFSPRSVTRSGNVIAVQFNVPVPPLQFDTSSVLPKAGMGFEYSDGSVSSPYIVSAQISATDTVTLTLNQTPSTSNAEHLRYAFTGVPNSVAGGDHPGSARGNLKDSDNTVSAYGDSLANWAVAFDKVVTAVQ